MNTAMGNQQVEKICLGELLVMVVVCYPKKGEASPTGDTDIILTT